MNRVASWLATERSRLASIARLEDVLVGIRPERYIWHRSRYVLLRALLRTGLRIVELALFASAIPFELLSSVFVVRSCLLVTEGLWWGALEPLRNDTRALAGEGRTGQASVLIRQWLLLSVVVGAVGLVLASSWVRFGPSVYRTFSVVDAYLLCCALRWAFDLWTMTYQAGVNGVWRVYRPLWSLTLVDVADVVVLGLAFWWLGVWGLGPALALVGMLRAVVSWRFTRRVYLQLALNLGGRRAWLRAKKTALWPIPRSVRFAFANIVGEVDSLLVLGLLAAPGNPEGALLLAALFHVLTPLQSAASSAPRLFYFDFKRLQAWGSPLLLRRFEAFLERAMWWTPLPIGLATLAILAAFWRGSYGWLALELCCFAVVRSRLAWIHVRAYALADHTFLWRLFCGMLAVAALTPFVAHLEPEVALGLVTGLSAAGLFFVGRSRTTLLPGRSTGLLGASFWVNCLVQTRGPVQLGLARVDRRLTTLGRVERAWRTHLGGAVTARLSHDTLVWFADRTLDPKALTVLASGALRELRLTPLLDGGVASLAHGIASPTWQRHFGFLSEGAPDTPLSGPHAFETLKADLLALHPHLELTPLTAGYGALLNVKARATTALVPQLAGSDRRALTRLFLDAMRGHAKLHTLGAWDVAVFAPGGTPSALLSAPMATRPDRPRWRSELLLRLQRAEIRTSVARALAEQRQNPTAPSAS